MGKYFEIGELDADLWHYATSHTAAIGMKMLRKPEPVTLSAVSARRVVRLPPGTERKESWKTLALALRRTRYAHLTKTAAARALIADAADYVNGGAFSRHVAANREPAREPEQTIHQIMLLHGYDGKRVPSLATLKRLF